MKVVIIGYGKMGKAVHEVLESRNHIVKLIIDEHNSDQINSLTTLDVDVAIEFTHPDAGFDNVMKCLSQKVPVVTGTTGWHDRLPEAGALAKSGNTALLYASNFSVGVNILFAMNDKLAALMNHQEQYKPEIEETHHIHKKDKPSGTAVTLAKQIVDNIDRYTEFGLEQPAKNSVNVKSHRVGEVFGEHEIQYDSDIDTITLAHSAKSRKGFALGAVLAAEHIYNKQGVFTMKEVLNM